MLPDAPERLAPQACTHPPAATVRLAASDEAVRLAALRDLLVLDTPPEPLFDSIARLASEVCGAPIALLSLVDDERQWFKANVGLPGVNETPRDVAFCAHALCSDDVFEVPDATCDARFATNPLVTGAPDIRFYAGAPLVTPGGERVGTLCVIDRQARQLDAAQTTMLRSLAEITMQALAMRRDLITKSLSVRSDLEQALRVGQAFLVRTGRVAGVGGWELDLASGVISWSDETRRIHEVPADYLPNLDNAISFYAPEARPVIEAAVQRGLSHGEPWDLELQFITATGRQTWVRAQGEVEFDNGQAVRLVGAFQDIGERKRLEQRVADNERFMRLITDNLPMGIAYLDRDRRFLFANQMHCWRFGRAREDIVGRTRSELTSGSTDAVVEPRIDAVLAGEAQRFEYDDSVGGEMRRIESRLIPDIDDRGEVRGFFSTGQDITDRARAERDLRLLTTIFDNTSDHVVQTDWRGQIVYMNPAVRRLVGLGADEPVADRHFGEFNTPETNRRFAEVIVPAVKASDLWVGETTVIAAHGRIVPISHMVIAHRGQEGRVERYSSVMRDISAEARAKQQQQRQTATLSSITEAIPASIAVIGIDGRYRFVNGAFEQWLDRPRDSILGRLVRDVLGTAEFERRWPWVERARNGETVHFQLDYPDRQHARHLAISYIPLTLDDGVLDGFVAVAQDITTQKREELRLRHLTNRDALTGVLNRAGFEALD